MKLVPFLADDQIDDLMRTERSAGGMSGREILMLIGAFTLAILLSIIVAFYIYKRQKHRSRHSKGLHDKAMHKSKPSGKHSGSKHRRRRHHTPEGPKPITLADTGGLPPRRDGKNPPSIH